MSCSYVRMRTAVILMYTYFLVGSGAGLSFESSAQLLSFNESSPSPGPLPSFKGDSLDYDSVKGYRKPDQNSERKFEGNQTKVGAEWDNSANMSLLMANNNAVKESTGSESSEKDDHKRENGIPTPLENSEVQKKEDDSCDTARQRCTDQKELVACFYSGIGKGASYLVVKNKGEYNLMVHVSCPPSVQVEQQQLQLSKHRSKKVGISIHAQGNSQIILSAGSGDCVLLINNSISAWKYLQSLPTYTRHVTPIFGAYFLSLMVLIVGGLWACCRFIMKFPRRDSGMTYQELEMGMPQSELEAVADMSDGWNQGWDDVWEEQSMQKTSVARPAGSISANGVIARPSNRDDWDDDWYE